MILTSDLWSETVTLTFDLGQDVPRRTNWVVSEDLISNRISTCLSYIVPHYDLITNPDWFPLGLGDAFPTNPHRLNSIQVWPCLKPVIHLDHLPVSQSVCVSVCYPGYNTQQHDANTTIFSQPLIANLGQVLCSYNTLQIRL